MPEPKTQGETVFLNFTLIISEIVGWKGKISTMVKTCDKSDFQARFWLPP
jgi:hypothetical protein